MIEFALLFALGFLAAGLLGLLVAPVIQRRIVRFAEDRLKATMPLSPQEVRAQKDAARAVYAAENARIGQTLKRERDRNTNLMLARETAVQTARLLDEENGALKSQIAAMSAEAGDLRASLRQFEQNIDRLKASLSRVEDDYSGKVDEASLLARQLDRVSAEVDRLRADLSTQATETENLHARIAGLREERQTLRDVLKRESEQTRALQLKLVQEEVRGRQMEARLAQETAASTDKDGFLERRNAEIERLTSRSRETAAALNDATRQLRMAGLALPEVPPANASDPPSAEPVPEIAVPRADDITTPAPFPTEEDVRARAARFIDALTGGAPGPDADLRNELAALAADMTALTARREGPSSPIHALLDKEVDEGGRLSLASRTRTLLTS